ncbi:dual specificity protein phosphatase family protein [bacterium]|nr:dual specificity protein phosphatase family protein [bacterium]
MKAPQYATFKYITPGLIKSSRPNFRQIYSLKKEWDVTLIYDFRHRVGDDLHHKALERVLSKVFGIEYHRMPFSFKHDEFPKLEDFEKVSKAIEENRRKGNNTLVHCRSGRHRSGQYAAFYELTHGQTLEEVSKQKDFLIKAYEIINKYFNFNNHEYWKREYLSEVVENPKVLRHNIDNNNRLDDVARATEKFIELIYSKLQS